MSTQSHPAGCDLYILVRHKSQGTALEDFLTREVTDGKVGEIPPGSPKGAESSHGPHVEIS